MDIVRLDTLRDIDATLPGAEAGTRSVLDGRLNLAFRVWDDEVEAMIAAGYLQPRAEHGLASGYVLTRHGEIVWQEYCQRTLPYRGPVPAGT